MKAILFTCAFLCIAFLLILFPATAAASGGSQEMLSINQTTEVCSSRDAVQRSTAETDLISGTTPASMIPAPPAGPMLSASSAVASSADPGAMDSAIGWWVALGAIICIIAVFVIFRKKLFRKLPRALFVIISIVLVLALIVPVVALSNPQAVDTFFGSSAAKTVRFETNGGSVIPAVEVPSGGKLDKIPTPAKADHAFTGWYTDEKLSSNFYSDAPITRDMTLYASYAPVQTNLKQYEDPGKYVEDCGPDYAVVIVSPVALTAENLSAHVQAAAYTEDFPQLNISGSGGVYRISPATPYPAGGHYRFTLLDDALSFQGESGAVRSWDFRIHKDAVSIVQPKEGIHYILWSRVDELGDGAYYVPASLGVKTGDSVCFWDGEINGDTRFCHILRAAPKKVGGRSMTLLTTEESRLSDILDKVDVCFQQDIPMKEFLGGANTDKIAMNAQNSAGARELTNQLAHAISRSPSFQRLMSEPRKAGAGNGTLQPKRPASGETLLDDGAFQPVEENDDKTALEIKNALTKGLTVTATVGTAQNGNFPGAGKEGWAVLTLTFAYETVIKDKVQINASFTVKEYLKSTMNTYAGPLPQMCFDYAINNYSQTQFDLSVLIKSKDTSEKDFLNITEEFAKLTNTDSEDDGDVTGILDDVLGAKGDYIDLVDTKLGSYTCKISPTAPIFKLKFDLNYTVKVNFAAGLSAHTTVMAARQVGIRGSMGGDVSTYQNALPGDNRYSFDFYCAGYLGFKQGLKVKITLSVNGLPKLGEVGVEGEAGTYLDLYGFVHLNISKLQQYSDAGEPSILGGLYMEIGIYVDLKLFAKSDWFKAKAEVDLLKLKIPIITIGDRYVFLRFTDGASVIINEEEYPLYGSAGLFDAEYIDMTTGEIVTGSYNPTRFTVQFSSPYFAYNYGTMKSFSVLKDRFGREYYSPMVPAGTKRLDTTVYVYYTGRNLAFSNQDTDLVKQINLTWIDSSIDLSNYPDVQSVRATYVADIDGVEQQVAEKLVPFGSIPGSIDYSAYMSSCKLTGCTNDPAQPILQDTVYTFHLKRYQRLVSFLTYHGGAWHFDVYAVKIGDMPKPPAGYDSPGPGVDFTGWIGTPGASAGGPGVTNAVTAVDFAVTNPAEDPVYLDLDTSKPVYSISGSYDECCSSYSSSFQGVPFNMSSQYLYTAQYQGGPYTINFVCPAMSYMFNGSRQNFNATTYSFKANFYEQIPLPPAIPSYPGCDMLGWDADGDGAADYASFAELPRATQDIELTAVIKHKTYTVTVLDINGKVDKRYKVNCGDLPAVLETEPVYPGEGDYQFKYWAVSKSGGAFVQWDTGSDPGVFEDWAIRPVYNKLYTVTFDYAGGSYDGAQSKVLKLEPGTYNMEDLVKDVSPVKADDVHYKNYVFTGWYYAGTPMGSTFQVTGDMKISARYTSTPILYTVEFRTEAGVFADGSTSATCTDDYDSLLAFIDDFMAANPLHTYQTSTADKIYTLESWDIQWSGTSVRYDAVWSFVLREYTVTFDADGGTFPDGTAPTIQTYHYNDAVSPPADPVKADDATYSYDFIGWSPSLASVTEDCTYVAAWRAVRKDVAETGITVTDGVHTEDINCSGKDVAGYTYAADENPVLTITGDGLTFSGSNNNVHVIIGQTCGSVSFDDLDLQVAYSHRLLDISGGTAGPVTIHIWGNCRLENTYDGAFAIFSSRPYVLRGRGTGPSLSIASVGASATCSTRGGMEVNNLTLDVTAVRGSYPESPPAFFGDCGPGNVWRFVDSTVNATGGSVIFVQFGSVEIVGRSYITFTSDQTNRPVIHAFDDGDVGALRFVDFTGDFIADYSHPGADVPAIQVTGGITFAPDVSDYDLEGAEVILIDGYYTFAIGTVPQFRVHVTPGP